MSIKRALFSKIKGLNKSVLLLGPRQTGKSTLMRLMKPDLEINLADQEQFLKHLSNPGFIKSLTKGKKTIFVDEVQRIPSLLNTIQSIIDLSPDKKFYLTGSSARKLKKGKANLLPGRIVSYSLGPLTHKELGGKFELKRALELGLLPGVYLEEDHDLAVKVLKTYSSTYLAEEVQAEALTRNLEGFSRFFQVISSKSGEFLDYSKFSSQAMIDRSSARRYFDILIDTLALSAVDPFAKSGKTRLIQHPRFYFFDVGALNGAVKNFKVSSERVGSLFEHLFLQLLISSAKAFDDDIRVSVYRTQSGAEVDFIIEKESELFAVEVKASKNIGKHDLRGLKSFSSFYGKPHTPFVVYLGEDSFELEGVQVVPLLEGLNLLGY